jgi:hypothetical protein
MSMSAFISLKNNIFWFAFLWQVIHEDRSVEAPSAKKKVPKPKQTPVYRNATLSATQRIKQKLLELSSNYHKVSLSYKQVLSQLLEDLKLSVEMSTELWGTARKVCMLDWKVTWLVRNLNDSNWWIVFISSQTTIVLQYIYPFPITSCQKYFFDCPMSISFTLLLTLLYLAGCTLRFCHFWPGVSHCPGIALPN